MDQVAVDIGAVELEPFRGFVPTVDRSRLDGLGMVAAWVAGVSYQLENAQDDTFAPLAALQLVPEPANPRDSTAVGVWNANRTLQLGYVPRQIVHRHQSTPLLSATSLLEAVDEHGKRAAVGAIFCTSPFFHANVVELAPDRVVRYLRRYFPPDRIPSASPDVDPLEQMRQAAEWLELKRRHSKDHG